MLKYTDTNFFKGDFYRWWRFRSQVEERINRAGRAGVEENKDINLFDLSKEFNIKGFELGNWCSSLERHDFANAIALSLADLSAILGSKNIGFDNHIGIAFGARGMGSSALAHFEPTNNMINLTKLKGYHSLAHEYGHALDYNFGEKIDQCKGYWALSGGRSTAATLPTNEGGQLRYLVNKIIDTIKTTESYDRIKNTSEYWHRRNEIFARFFEQLISYLLKEKGANNIFLAQEWKTYITKSQYLTESDFMKVLPDAKKLLSELSKFLNNKNKIKKMDYWKQKSVKLVVPKSKKVKIAAGKEAKQTKPKTTKSTTVKKKEEPLKEYKFYLKDLFKFTDDKNEHKAYSVVYFDKGFAVATNGHILAKIKCSYPKNLEGKCINTKEAIVNGIKYPAYNLVIPNINSLKNKTVLSLKKYQSLIERAKHLSVLNGKKKLNYTAVLCGDGTEEYLFRFDSFNVAVSLANKIDSNAIMYWDYNQRNKLNIPTGAIIDLKNNGCILIMPILPDMQTGNILYYETPEIKPSVDEDPSISVKRYKEELKVDNIDEKKKKTYKAYIAAYESIKNYIFYDD